MNSRAVAAQIIYHVIVNRRSLDDVLRQHISEKNTAASFIKELCFGTLRYYYRLAPAANKLLLKPLAKKHQDIFCVLLIGLYQLSYLSVPAYAAIKETVDAVKQLKKNWAVGLINKTLRLFSQHQSNILAEVDQIPAQHYAHPTWIIDKIRHDWPQHWQEILMANNHKAPMVIRVNPTQITREKYLEHLAQSNIAAQAISTLPFAIQLQQAVTVSELPGFAEGWCYLQDEAGQHIAPLLQLDKDLSVLDACAAPGSKTTDILASAPHLKKLVAIDHNPSRLQKIKENIDRLKLNQQNIQLLVADAAKTRTWWDGECFDRILIDAPCSASGVIRRHPDIKILRQSEDIAQQQQVQRTLLNALWPLLKPNGLLLYSTCSIFAAENSDNISYFLKQHTDAEALTVPIGLPQINGSQLLPCIDGPDGFYYALLRKTPAPG